MLTRNGIDEQTGCLVYNISHVSWVEADDEFSLAFDGIASLNYVNGMYFIQLLTCLGILCPHYLSFMQAVPLKLSRNAVRSRTSPVLSSAFITHQPYSQQAPSQSQHASLPSLPVPPLRQTLDKYLLTVKPLLSEDEFKYAEQVSGRPCRQS